MLSENIERDRQGRLRFAGCDVERLADEYGTPLYLMDEQRVRENCRRYRAAFLRGFGGNAKVLYASKAASFREIYRIMAEEGMGVDTVSCGEIYTAISAGFPASEIYFHGNCKMDADIRYAVAPEGRLLCGGQRGRTLRPGTNCRGGGHPPRRSCCG